jgi:2-polyprenyl-3-methyl-5-hydroxy-6-metoxy-1,4-benzoquinol methylase
MHPANFKCADRPWPDEWACEGCRTELQHRSEITFLAPELAESSSTYNPEMFDTLVKIEETNFWFVNRAALIVWLVKRHFPHGGKMLEVGCGTGSVLLALRRSDIQFKLFGSELHSRGLEFARQRLDRGITLMQMDARKIPARGEFDVIGAFDVLEHIPEDDEVMRQMYSALRPNGGVIIAVPQHPWLWSPADEEAQHQRRYALGELETKLKRCGFAIERTTSFNSLLLPAMVASRQLLKYRARQGQAQQPLAEFETTKSMNSLLSAILRLEVATTKTGITWPVGGSRFVVARRP